MRWQIGIIGVSIGLVACGTESSGGSGGSGGGASSTSNASTSNASTSNASTSSSSGTGSTSSSSGMTSSSSGGGLPFGAVCTMNSDCMTMLCHDFAMKGMHCTKACTTIADCPMGSMCGGMMVCSIP